MSLDTAIASLTSQPCDFKNGMALASSSVLRSKASSNRRGVRLGRSMNFRNSKCLLHTYFAPFHSISLSVCAQWAIVVYTDLGGLPNADDSESAGFHQSMTTGGRVG